MVRISAMRWLVEVLAALAPEPDQVPPSKILAT